ncbi:MAG: FHA domain-containing protein [Woeseiaceae bacterium]
MANENKNINELVSDDDDPTAELEILSFRQFDVDEISQAESESDSHTCGLGDTEDADSGHGQSIPELQSDLRSRTKTIGQLQFDIEQLRSKWLGLETEISAREEIVSNLLGDVDKLNGKIARKDKLLNKRNATVKSLKAEIRQRDKEQRSLEQEIAEQQAAVVVDGEALEAAERELHDVRAELATAHTAIEDAEQELGLRDEKFSLLEQQLSEQQQTATSQAEALEVAQRQIDTLNSELELAANEEHNLNSEINLRDGLESELETTNAVLADELALLRLRETERVTELQAAKQELAQVRLDLEIASQNTATQITQTQKTTSSVVRELHAQLEKNEQYADTLRFKFQDSSKSLEDISKQRDRLSDELAAAVGRERKLADELTSAEKTTSELQATLEQKGADHEQEIRTLRFELSEAQDSMAQSGDLNSQLASDLMSTRSFKEELERMLMSNEEDAQERISELEQQVKKLSETTEELKQKLDTKNTAINVLLAELAKKTEQIESIGEIEDVIHEIDNRMSGRFGESNKDTASPKSITHTAGDRDRITRVLVGSIGDQELRFPLFKNRLTIGRTADNDIQLKTSYISRRHAVVLTEGDDTRVIDWGSKNGVYVNSERVKERFLSNGDIVAVGNAKFRYEERPKRES